MPKKKVVRIDEPIIASRPQRNTRAKKVFDPSDNYLPKRRNKPAVKFEKPTETNKKNNHEKKKNQDSKSKSNLVNESLDSSSIDIPSSPVHSSSTSPVTRNSPEFSIVSNEKLDVCFLCSKNLQKNELLNCPICFVKVHTNCIIVDEPMWRFKLDKCPWLCRKCRKSHCSKCLGSDSNMEISRRCITCKVGLHLNCYEKYDIKPLHTLQINMFVCIPCMTLAIHRIPEEEDEEEKIDEFLLEEEGEEEEERKEKEIREDEEEDAITIRSSSVNHTSSDEEDNNLSIASLESLLDSDKDQDLTLGIPDISNWTKYKVYDYLTGRCLPKEILAKIITNDIDGHALQLLKRTDVTFNMGLKLGLALKFYKEIRILQSQSTYHGIFWE